jgi:type II secretory pathway component PulJ
MMKEPKYKKPLSSCHGQSLIEVIIAMAIFSLIVVSIVGLVLGGLALLTEGGRFSHADHLAQEGLEAVRAIFRNDWNKSTLNKSAIAINNNQWELAGEDTSEQIGQYTRTINFYPVYRNENGEIVSSSTSGSYNDIQSKRVKVRVEWLARNGANNHVENESLLSNWSVSRFIQTDWSGGMGQAIWSDELMYDSDDGQIFASSSLSLKEMATSTYASSGYLVSSAYQIPESSGFLALEWSDDMPETCAECAVKIQLKFAPDSGDSPGVWTEDWTGPEGDDDDEDDYYTLKTGELIPTDFSEAMWVRYKMIMEGNTIETPHLEEIRIIYKR